jgi:hypothetical protein
MAILGAKVDVSGPMAAFQNLRREQLPWTIARALTKTAQAAQISVRRLEGEVFRMRNDWIVRNTKITPATKSLLVATVYEDIRNRKGIVGDYLSDQEAGGTRPGYVTVEGRRYRAIPTKYLNPFGRVIPRELLPQNLLGAVAGRFTTYNRKGQIALKNQRLVNGMVFFVQKLKGGDLAICGRRPHTQDALPFYILIHSARISARFPMFVTVDRVAQGTFPENLRNAAIETMGNDLLRGSGLRIKL